MQRLARHGIIIERKVVQLAALNRAGLFQQAAHSLAIEIRIEE